MAQRRSSGVGGVMLAALALAFNGALLATPLLGARLLDAIATERAFDHHVSPATEERTRQALERALAGLADPAIPARDAWASLVGRELIAGDVASARGFLLSAQELLSPPEAARLAALLPSDSDDDRLADAAATFLPDDVQRHFDTLGGARSDASAAPVRLGDANDFATAVALAARGEPADRFGLALQGFAIANQTTSDQGEREAVGAALLRAARRAGALTPAFSTQIETALAAAAPPERLDAALAEIAATSSDMVDPLSISTEPFLRAFDPAGSRSLRTLLQQFGALAEAGGAATAIRLLPFAESANDLTALRLLAAGGGDRAVAVAKYAPDRATLIGYAPRTLAISPRIRNDAWLLAGSGLVVLLSFGGTLALQSKRPPAPMPRRPSRTPNAPRPHDRSDPAPSAARERDARIDAI